MSVKLTKKQTLVYDFIKEFIAEKNYAPSYRDIRDGLGLSSVSAVAEHVDNLVKLGALKKSSNAARSLEIVDTSYPETTALFKFKLQSATSEEADLLLRAANLIGLDLEDPEEEETNV